MPIAEEFSTQLRERVRGMDARIAFPDSLDPRTLRAVEYVIAKNIIIPIFVGERDAIYSLAEKENIRLGDVSIIDPVGEQNGAMVEELAQEFFTFRKHKNITLDEAKTTVAKPLYCAGMLVRNGFADGAVAGSLSFTGDVVRAGVQCIGMAVGISIVSSYFLIIFPDKIYCFADCGVVPEPNSSQLADIAISAADNFRRIVGESPRIAMLSFSSHGSAEHTSVSKVREATAIIKERNPALEIDGELQLDAAIVPDVAKRKAPDSPLQGNANVLIFPDLNSGNIGYKIAERLGGAKAIGPIIQGLAKPFLDLSRGCSVDDIIDTACIAAIAAKTAV